MKMLIDYSGFSFEQYGTKEKRELVKLIATNIKECQDPIEEEETAGQEDDYEDVDDFDV